MGIYGILSLVSSERSSALGYFYLVAVTWAILQGLRITWWNSLGGRWRE
jgi:hypothetical protein